MGVAVTGNGKDVGAGVSPSHAEAGTAGMTAMRTHRATIRPYGFAVRPFPLMSRELLYLTSRDRAEDIVLVNEKDLEKANQPPPDGHEADSDLCSWWRRRRVELHREHELSVFLAAW